MVPYPAITFSITPRERIDYSRSFRQDGHTAGTAFGVVSGSYYRAHISFAGDRYDE